MRQRIRHFYCGPLDPSSLASVTNSMTTRRGAGDENIVPDKRAKYGDGPTESIIEKEDEELYSLEDVRSIARNAAEAKQWALRRDYDQLLNSQLRGMYCICFLFNLILFIEQFNQFTQFNQDNLSSQVKESDFSYLS